MTKEYYIKEKRAESGCLKFILVEKETGKVVCVHYVLPTNPVSVLAAYSKLERLVKKADGRLVDAPPER